MDLKEFLLDVFPNKDEEKYTKMIDNLKRLSFDSMSDLKYLDEEAVKELNSFHCSDIERLTDYLAKCEFETQDDVFYEIFSGIPLERIKEIKIFLNKHEVYARSDVLLININKMKAKEFFSESELMRIESFLGKNLIQALHKIFSGVDAQRISEIQKILKEQNITAKKDLIYVDIEKFRNGKILADIEVSKFETFLEENYKEQFLKKKEAMELEKSKDLRHVLNEIFFGTPTNRLEKIGGILKEEKIYSGKDILIADLNSLHLKESLSCAEMLKFEEFLKKSNFFINI